jgi:hypothetical protein
MIKFEHGMLVLNNQMTKEDVEQINGFAHYVRKQEQEYILNFLDNLLEEPSKINLQGAIKLLKDDLGTSN